MVLLVVTAVPVAAATPDAVDDAYTTVQDQTLSVDAPGVLANDTVEGATLALESGPTYGTLTLDGDGSFTYTPDAGFIGTDSFVYSLTGSSTSGAVALGDTDPGADDGLVTPQPAWVRGAAAGAPVVFVADDGVHGREPWVADGAAGSAQLLRDINPAGDAFGSTGPPDFTSFDGYVWFAADDGTGPEVWRTDGTAAGTEIAFELTGRVATAPPGAFTVSGGRMYFAAEGSLWVLDAADATPMLLADSGTIKAAYADGVLLYTQLDPAIGFELYYSDGGAPQLVHDVAAGSSSSSIGTVSTFGTDAWFEASSGLWHWDGVGDAQLVDDVDPAILAAGPGGAYLLFTFSGTALVRYQPDGTSTTLASTGGGVAPFGPVVPLPAEGLVLFTASDTDHGREVWVTDGTTAGTDLLVDLRPGTGDGYLAYTGNDLSPVGGAVYFGGDDGVHGTEVWSTDGTAAGTQRLTDVNAASGSDPIGYSAAGDGVFFWARDGSTGYEPYLTSGAGGANDQATVTITVEAAEQPPVLDPIGDQSVTVGQQLSFTATATDPDGDALTFSLAGTVPDGASITADGLFTWTPDAPQVGEHTFDVVASDGTLQDAETVTVTVTEATEVVVLTVREGVGVVDLVTVTGAVQLVVSEGIGVGDTVEITPAVQLFVTEGIGVHDAVRVDPPVVIELTEGIGVADVVTFTTVSEGVLLDDDGLVQQALMGETYTFSGDGFAAGAEVLLQLFSDPVVLGTTTADDTGAFSAEVTIPTTDPGAHTLIASGTGPTGVPHEARAPITVLAPAEVDLLDVPDRIRVRGAAGTAPEFSLTAAVTSPLVDLDVAAGAPTIRLVPIGPGAPVEGDCQLDTDLLSCAFHDVPVNGWVVEATIGPPFLGADQDVLLVDDPTRGSTHGAGRFAWPATTPTDTVRPGSSSLAYNVRYDPFGTPWGHLHVTRQLDSASGTVRSHATQLHGVALGPADASTAWAVLISDAPPQPGPATSGTGTLVVYVEDGGTDGKDRVWARHFGDGSEQLQMPRPAVTEAVWLDHGDLRVTSNRSLPWR